MKNSPFGLCNLSPWFVGGAAQEVPYDFSIKARQTSQNSRFFPPSTRKKQLGGDSEEDKKQKCRRHEGADDGVCRQTWRRMRRPAFCAAWPTTHYHFPLKTTKADERNSGSPAFAVICFPRGNAHRGCGRHRDNTRRALLPGRWSRTTARCFACRPLLPA